MRRRRRGTSSTRRAYDPSAMCLTDAMLDAAAADRASLPFAISEPESDLVRGSRSLPPHAARRGKARIPFDRHAHPGRGLRRI